MPTPDIVLLIVILVSALIGLMRGLLKEVISVASWLAAFLLALYLSPVLADNFAGRFGAADRAVAFGLIFVVVLILGGLVQFILSKLVQTTGLSGTDRFLGFLFGSVRGTVVCIVGLIALRGFAEDSDWWQESTLVPHFLAFEEDVLSAMGRARQAVTGLGEQLEK